MGVSHFIVSQGPQGTAYVNAHRIKEVLSLFTLWAWG